MLLTGVARARATAERARWERATRGRAPVTASNRWLAIVAGAIALAVVAGIAVTVLAGGERTYEEGTPERAVQDYLRAVGDRDATTALALLAPSIADRCDTIPRDGITDRGTSSIRATLDRTTIRDDGTAEVRVRITESYGSDSPFGGGDSTMTQVFLLTKVDGQWRFSDAPWPTYCPLKPAPAR